MSMTKNQRFGLIVFIILIIAAILVTLEPWNRSSRKVNGTLETRAPDKDMARWLEAVPEAEIWS